MNIRSTKDMDIKSVKDISDDTLELILDRGPALYVPKTENNRHYRAITEWTKKDGVIER